MSLTLPSFLPDDPISATYTTKIANVLRDLKAIADAPRNPIQERVIGGGILGNIIHNYNTLQYSVTHNTNSTTTITVNGVPNNIVGTGLLTGFFTLGGLTIGKAYQVTVAATDAANVVNYMYQELTETYIATPDFTGNNAADMMNNMNDAKDRVNDLVNLAQTPVTSFKHKEAEFDSYDRNIHSPYEAYAGWAIHTHGILEFEFEHTADTISSNSAKSFVSLIINGVSVFTHKSGQRNNPNVTAVDLRINGFTESVTALIDISSFGLVEGSFYRWSVEQSVAGTDAATNIGILVSWLSTVGSTGAWVNPVDWFHGERNTVDFDIDTRLNVWSDDIDILFPGSPSPEGALYYVNYVNWEPGKTDYTMRRRKKYLVYKWKGVGGTPQLAYGAKVKKFELEGKTGYRFVDLDTIPFLHYGVNFSVDDALFVAQVDDVSTLV